MCWHRVCLGALCCLAFAPALPAPAEPPARSDLYGDQLPPGCVVRLGTIRLRTRGPAVRTLLRK